MTEQESPDFHITVADSVSRELDRLMGLAAHQGKQAALAKSVRTLLHLLRTDPQGCGDPDWNTRFPGGTVYHLVQEPLLVHYAVYPAHRVVFLYRLMALSTTYLAEE